MYPYPAAKGSEIIQSAQSNQNGAHLHTEQDYTGNGEFDGERHFSPLTFRRPSRFKQK